MRRVFEALALGACLWPGVASALTDVEQAQIVVVISTTEVVAPTQVSTALLQCPTGHYAIEAGWAPLHRDEVVNQGYNVVNGAGQTIDINGLTDASSLLGGGYTITVQNLSTLPQEYLGQVVCQKPLGNISFVRASTTVPPGATGNLTTPCPAGRIATGSLTNLGAGTLTNLGRAPVWYTGMTPNYLGNATASQLPLPNGWEVSAQNDGTAARTLTQFVLCSDYAPSLGLTLTYNYRPTPGSKYYMTASVPDTHFFLTVGFDGFPYNRPYADFRTWHRDWSVPATDFAANVHAFDMPKVSSDIRVFGYYAGDFRPQYAAKAFDTVLMGVVALPRAAATPAPTIATVVEFYNAALDHYFITAAPAEINDLDTGVHVGWARTGQSFHAYAAGSTGRTGRQPVCRAYGNPAVGLDSHFYSAALNECFDTLARFAGSWLLEADEVFQIDLPDAATGACPVGDIPVYRVFNNRADANHRYTISTAIRDQMVARGYIAEGYGPNSVTLCALP